MGRSVALISLGLAMMPGHVLGQTKVEKFSCGNKSDGPLHQLIVHEEEYVPNSQYRINLNDRGEIPIVVHYAYDPNSEQLVSVTPYQIDQMIYESNLAFGEPFHFVVDKMVAVEDESILKIEGELYSEDYQTVYKMFKANEEDAYKIHVYFPFYAEKICGLSSFPISEEQGMIVSGHRGCAGTEKNPLAQVLIHELGHFFNLHHTFHNFNIPNLSERVVRDRRCKTQGDGFCDTPADFYPSYFYQVFSELPACRFDPYNPNRNLDLPNVALDMEGKLYNPSVTNYMSYFENSCLTEFTPEQKVMLKQAYDYRVYKPVEIPEFTVYPNPAKGLENVRIMMDIDEIENSDLIQYQLRIYNSIGQEITSQTILGSNYVQPTLNSLQDMQLQFLASGNYFVNLVLIDTRTQKIIYDQTQKMMIIN